MSAVGVDGEAVVVAVLAGGALLATHVLDPGFGAAHHLREHERASFVLFVACYSLLWTALLANARHLAWATLAGLLKYFVR